MHLEDSHGWRLAFSICTLVSCSYLEVINKKPESNINLNALQKREMEHTKIQSNVNILTNVDN